MPMAQAPHPTRLQGILVVEHQTRRRRQTAGAHAGGEMALHEGRARSRRQGGRQRSRQPARRRCAAIRWCGPDRPPPPPSAPDVPPQRSQWPARPRSPDCRHSPRWAAPPAPSPPPRVTATSPAIHVRACARGPRAGTGGAPSPSPGRAGRGSPARSPRALPAGGCAGKWPMGSRAARGPHARSCLPAPRRPRRTRRRNRA
ncbi:hypothetical protein D3C87_1362440 [compost metagenome]